MKFLAPTEASEGRALIKWASFHPICKELLIHIKNGGSLASHREGYNFKAQGVRKGVSDYFLPYPCSGYHGLWIELKRRNGEAITRRKTHAQIKKIKLKFIYKATKEQLEWGGKMVMLGYEFGVCYGWEDAKNFIEEYLSEG